MSDGGEGAVQSLVTATGGLYQVARVSDPLMRPVVAQYGIIEGGVKAVIEMAAASGLELLSPAEYNPFRTTTFGTGELILNALDQGCRQFIIGIGGSATNDGGAGMLSALGARLLDEAGAIIDEKGGEGLSRITKLDLSGLDERLQSSSFEIACDVTNPLTGPRGATYVYARQKGARDEDLAMLEAGMENWGRVLEESTGKEIVNVAGAGAAGGLGAGLLALPHAELKSGFGLIRQATNLEARIAESDVIITGEGRVDGQTLYGKVVSGIGVLAAKYNKPVICIAGTLDRESQILLDHGITALFSIVDKPMDLQEAMDQTPRLLENSARSLGALVGAFVQKEN